MRLGPHPGTSFRNCVAAIVKARRARENSRTMPNKDVVLIILAAGKGTRLKSSVAKVLHSAGGRPLIEHVLRACVPVKAKRIVTVVGYRSEERRVGKECRSRWSPY